MEKKQTELMMGAEPPEGGTPNPAAPVLDLTFMVEWQPASEPPTGASKVDVFCVSTPNCTGQKHQLAHWDKRGWWVSINSTVTVEGVTYWCDLPCSPEWVAEHPDDFVECDFSDHPMAKPNAEDLKAATGNTAEVVG